MSTTYFDVINFPRLWIQQNLKVEHVRRDKQTVCVCIVGELEQTPASDRLQTLDKMASVFNLNVVLQIV